jgi:muconolactone D-isomerase
VEFLVRFTWTVPQGMPEQQWGEIRSSERSRGRDLMMSGVMTRLWRMPGQRSVLGLFETADATELDKVLTSFPMHPYVEIEVEALGSHPLDAELRGSGRVSAQ